MPVIRESVNAGVGTVWIQGSRPGVALTLNVENLFTNTSDPFDGTGNSLDNRIGGGDGGGTAGGMSGNDSLCGGPSGDLLPGGDGATYIGIRLAGTLALTDADFIL